MSSSKKIDAARRMGGPGSSHQDRRQGEDAHMRAGDKPGTPTNSEFSRVSGGGGERDIHHTHNPEMKGLTGSPKRRHPDRDK